MIEAVADNLLRKEMAVETEDASNRADSHRPKEVSAPNRVIHEGIMLCPTIDLIPGLILNLAPTTG